ncbi:RNA binding domain-containing protein [Phthorimaea operculella]|nr:RNA binding domain-containing protein [Phthorimaea operculella]
MLSHLARMRGESLGRAIDHTAAIKPFLNKVWKCPYDNLFGICIVQMDYECESARHRSHECLATIPVFLAKTAHQNSPYMNLTGADPNPSRDHVFHLTFPKEWSRNDINQLFSPFCAITMQFLDDTSALVALSRKEQARDVQRALSGNNRVKLIPFHRYKQPNQVPVKDKPDRRDTSSIHNACVFMLLSLVLYLLYKAFLSEYLKEFCETIGMPAWL